MNQDILSPVTIHSGSLFCQAQVDGKPIYPFPSVVGKVNNQHPAFKRSLSVGQTAEALRGSSSLSYPISRGVIHNFGEIEQIWRHAFEELLLDPSEHPVLLTETPDNPNYIKEQMAQTIFESFNVPLYQTVHSAVTALLSTGRTTGMVVDSGDGASWAVPIYEGCSLRHSIMNTNIAGGTCTQWLINELRRFDKNVFNNSASQDIIFREIKEKFCYVAGDYENEKQKLVIHELPDGHEILLEKERTSCAEMLFNPSLFRLKDMSIPQIALTSANDVEKDLKRIMFENLLLFGGSTMFKGFVERFTIEINKSTSVPRFFRPQIVAPSNRQYSSCLGGRILATQDSFKSYWITKDEYNEAGEQIIYHKNCLVL